MKSSLFIRVLLSLLLLVTQQMAVGHALSHYSGAAEASAQVQADSKHGPASGLAHESGCAQCYAYAQLASAVGTPAYVLHLFDVRASHQAALLSHADCIRTVCVFQSRAPPLA